MLREGEIKDSAQTLTRSRKALVGSEGSELEHIIVRAPFKWPATILEWPLWTSCGILAGGSTEQRCSRWRDSPPHSRREALSPPRSRSC